ncbi:MAG: fibronectin type III domain-containing protein [Promethearchaeota archaeon]
MNIGILTTFSIVNAQKMYYGHIFGPYITWAGDDNDIFNMTSTSITISWKTPEPEESMVEYGTSPSHLDNKIMNRTRAIMHHVTLTGLTPRTTYYYRVGNSLIKSPVFHFTTMDENPDLMRFCIYGDTRPPNSRNEEVVDQMEKRNPQFWLHVGDLVGAGGDIKQWNDFLKQIRGLSERSSFMPVIGNHEYYGEATSEPETFYEIFSLPGDESTFAFEVGDILFMAINTRVNEKWENNHSVAPDEWAWANQTLAMHYRDYKWIVLYCHYPPYSSNGVSEPVYNDIVPLAETYDVDVVFTGHVHNYERFNVPNSRINGSAIPYFVTGGGGAPLSGLRDNPSTYSESYYSKYQYMYCEVNSTNMYFECVDINGVLLDNWTISIKDRTNI